MSPGKFQRKRKGILNACLCQSTDLHWRCKAALTSPSWRGVKGCLHTPGSGLGSSGCSPRESGQASHQRTDRLLQALAQEWHHSLVAVPAPGAGRPWLPACSGGNTWELQQHDWAVLPGQGFIPLPPADTCPGWESSGAIATSHGRRYGPGAHGGCLCHLRTGVTYPAGDKRREKGSCFDASHPGQGSDPVRGCRGPWGTPGPFP